MEYDDCCHTMLKAIRLYYPVTHGEELNTKMFTHSTLSQFLKSTCVSINFTNIELEANVFFANFKLCSSRVLRRGETY